MNLSQNLKNKREEHSFSQEDIAQKLNFLDNLFQNGKTVIVIRI